MSDLELLYSDLKTLLATVTGNKYVALWNNQFERERENVSFLFPCTLIQFVPKEFSDLLNGVQKYDIDVVIHCGFKSFKTDDKAILAFKQEVYKKCHRFQSGTFSMMLRRGEVEDFDHDDIQDYQQIYSCTGTDHNKDTRPTVQATLTDDLTKSIQKPDTI